MATEEEKKQKEVKKEQKKVAKTDGTYSFSNFAGDVSALSEWIDIGAGGLSQTLNVVNQIDAALTQLANLDLDGSCKGVQPSVKSPFEDGAADPIAATASRCNPFKKEIDNLGDDPSASDVVASVIGIIQKLLGPSSFPDCVFNQYKNFLSVVPVQYYLLSALKAAADRISEPVKELEKLSPCKNQNVAERIQNLDDELDETDIFTIPRLPYIPIPDLYQLVVNLILEIVCFSLCAALTPLIEEIGKLMVVEFGEDDKNSLTVEPNQPLQKIPIGQFLNDDVLTDIKEFVDKNIVKSEDITKELIKEYIVEVQKNEKISQEEFVFLLFGKINCNVFDTLIEIEKTIDPFGLDTEQKIKIFFSFVGSTINLLGFVKNSKAKVCEPDPCDVKTEQLVIENISNLCDLLNPQASIEIPTESVLEAGGAFDFIASSLEKSFNAIVSLSQTYNPIFDYSDTGSGNSSYVEKYSAFLLNFNEALLETYSTDNKAGNLLIEDRQIIREAIRDIRNFYYSDTFSLANVIPGQIIEESEYSRLVSSKNYKENGLDKPGVADGSSFIFNVFNRFSEDDIKKTIKFISNQSPSTTSDVANDMAEFEDLKIKYKITVENGSE